MTNMAYRLYDAAHAFGCSRNGWMIGGFGDAEILSFHATKFLNTFEGGAVLTDNDALAAKIRLMKNFGFSGYDNVIYIGINGKMSEISAVMGLTGLESLDDFIAANRRNYECYRMELRGVRGIRLLEYDPRERCNHQYVVLELDEEATGAGRDTLVDVLHAENVIARRYFHPGAHRMEPYWSHFPHAGLMLPETERLAVRVVSLPTGTSVGEREVRTICSILRFAVEHGPEISGRLP